MAENGESGVETRSAGMEAEIGPEETMGQVVQTGGASEGLVRRYADLGLIPHRRDSYGRRVFPAGTGEVVRRLKAERLARLGQRGVDR